MHLVPDLANVMYGRDGFLMHGDSLAPGSGQRRLHHHAPAGARGSLELWRSPVAGGLNSQKGTEKQ
jgi:hypothetical protein